MLKPKRFFTAELTSEEFNTREKIVDNLKEMASICQVSVPIQSTKIKKMY